MELPIDAQYVGDDFFLALSAMDENQPPFSTSSYHRNLFIHSVIITKIFVRFVPVRLSQKRVSNAAAHVWPV